jgi:hypothetical protein
MMSEMPLAVTLKDTRRDNLECHHPHDGFALFMTSSCVHILLFKFTLTAVPYLPVRKFVSRSGTCILHKLPT